MARTRSGRRAPTRLTSALAIASVGAALLGGCGDGAAGEPATAASAGGGWAETVRQARGQRVDWWMYGGDDRVNRYVDDHVVPAAREAGVKLRRVPIGDTADAVQRVLAQRRAGKRSGGAVDLIWINGENFATGKRAGLWLTDWATRLPNRRFLEPDDPSLRQDFGVRVEGQEAPWSRAAFVFAADTERVPEPPADLDGLLDWVTDNPGRFTYPAPPDFTGSSFVRQVVAAKGEDEGFAYLRRLKPLMHREGTTFPKSEAELNELFANGEVDIAMSYDASFALAGVRRGQFPDTTRPFLLGGRALTNVSFVTIPADAADAAGAQVVANLLLDPSLQVRKADPGILGHRTVLDPARLPPAQRRALEQVEDSPYLLDSLGEPLQELPADRVAGLEQRWKREVLRG